MQKSELNDWCGNHLMPLNRNFRMGLFLNWRNLDSKYLKLHSAKKDENVCRKRLFPSICKFSMSSSVLYASLKIENIQNQCPYIQWLLVSEMLQTVIHDKELSNLGYFRTYWMEHKNCDFFNWPSIN